MSEKLLSEAELGRILSSVTSPTDYLAAKSHIAAQSAKIEWLNAELTARNAACHDALEKLGAANAELAASLAYAKRLFSAFAPECEPFEELPSLLTQIDNCMAGMRNELAALKSPAGDEELAETCWNAHVMASGLTDAWNWGSISGECRSWWIAAAQAVAAHVRAQSATAIAEKDREIAELRERLEATEKESERSLAECVRQSENFVLATDTFVGEIRSLQSDRDRLAAELAEAKQQLADERAKREGLSELLNASFDGRLSLKAGLLRISFNQGGRDTLWENPKAWAKWAETASETAKRIEAALSQPASPTPEPEQSKVDQLLAGNPPAASFAPYAQRSVRGIVAYWDNETGAEKQVAPGLWLKVTEAGEVVGCLIEPSAIHGMAQPEQPQPEPAEFVCPKCGKCTIPIADSATDHYCPCGWTGPMNGLSNQFSCPNCKSTECYHSYPAGFDVSCADCNWRGTWAEVRAAKKKSEFRCPHCKTTRPPLVRDDGAFRCHTCGCVSTDEEIRAAKERE